MPELEPEPELGENYLIRGGIRAHGLLASG